MILPAVTRLLILLTFLTGLLITCQEVWPEYLWWLGGVLVLIGCAFTMLNCQHMIKGRFEGIETANKLWLPLILLTCLPAVTIHFLFDVGSITTAGLFVVMLAYSATVVQAYNRLRP